MAEEKKNGPEPSMEEILASIRRIISEGEPETTVGPGNKPAAPPDAPVADQAEPQVRTGRLASGDREEPHVRTSPFASRTPEEGDGGDDEILELTEMVQDDGTVVSLKAADKDDEIVMADAEEDMATQHAPGPADGTGKGEEPLVSEATAAAAAAAMAAIARSGTEGTTSDATGLGNRTLEAIVRDLLRPLLKEWLDQNLPAVVERVVRQEVRKIARRAED